MKRVPPKLLALLCLAWSACADDLGCNPGSGCGSDPYEPPEECSRLGEPNAVERQLRITLARAEPIYLDPCASRFSIVIGGEAFPGEVPTTGDPTCEEAVSGSEPCCSCVVRWEAIQAGSSFGFAWSGAAYRLTEAPEGCGEEDNPAVACYQGFVPAGALEIVLHAYATPGATQTDPPSDPFEVRQPLAPGSGPIEILVE